MVARPCPSCGATVPPEPGYPDTRLTDTHPPTAMRIARLQERGPASAAVTLDAWTSQKIDGELEPLEGRLGRELLDRYRGTLYFG